MSFVALDFKDVSEAAAEAFSSNAMNGDEYVRCTRCSFGGCDVRVAGCGCTLHARCIPLSNTGPINTCPSCKRPTTGLVMFPMLFREVDEARKTAATIGRNNKRGRKRKNAASNDLNAVDESANGSSDRRTGRWTSEELAFVDQLIDMFEKGMLPLPDGIKLNDFLSNMLKSKQSRLTKKMKNAKLSSKAYKRNTGYISDLEKARHFSDIEDAFYHSIPCHLEKAELKFHMQKEWREHLSNTCLAIGQPLDADSWLSSVEELDRRACMVKDAARVARRKLMMGFALKQDKSNRARGVFIETTESDLARQNDSDRIASYAAAHGMQSETEEFLTLLADKSIFNESLPGGLSASQQNGKSTSNASAPQPRSPSPFLSKVVAYMQRHRIPFEHVDAWVPSFLPEAGADTNASTSPSCRLCYAGCVTSSVQVNKGSFVAQRIPEETKFNLQSFGNYSEKFSFDVGCGLPGRVYQNGIPSWEQSVQNAPSHHFERCGGATQWGVRTVLGIPVPSPNVGRIVVVLYSSFDRDRDQEMVSRMCTEFSKLMPSPKWKLVVDLGEQNDAMKNLKVDGVAQSTNNTASVDTVVNDASACKKPTGKKDKRIEEVISLLGEHMPSDPSSNIASLIPGFMSLRLMLLKHTWTAEESQLIETMLGSYTSYFATGRSRTDIAILLARDCMFLQSQQNANTTKKSPSSTSFNSQPLSGENPSLHGIIPQLPNSSSNVPTIPPAIRDNISIVSN